MPATPANRAAPVRPLSRPVSPQAAFQITAAQTVEVRAERHAMGLDEETGRPLVPQVLQVSAQVKAQRRARRFLEEREGRERAQQPTPTMPLAVKQPTPPPAASTSTLIQVTTCDTPEGNVVEVTLFQIYILNW